MSVKKQLRIATRNSGFIDPENIDSYIAAGGYLGLAKCLGEMSPEQVIELMKKGADSKTVGSTRFLLMNPKRTLDLL